MVILSEITHALLGDKVTVQGEVTTREVRRDDAAPYYLMLRTGNSIVRVAIRKDLMDRLPFRDQIRTGAQLTVHGEIVEHRGIVDGTPVPEGKGRLELHVLAPDDVVLDLAGTTSSGAHPPAPIRWLTDLKTANFLTTRTKKSIIVYFDSPDHPVSRQVDAAVFGDPRVRTLVATRCVPLRINILRQKELAQRLGATNGGTIILYRPDGTAIKKLDAPKTPESLIQLINALPVASLPAPGGTQSLDPSRTLVLVGQVNVGEAVHSVHATGKYAYMLCAGDKVVVADISDPANPRIVSRATPGPSRPGWRGYNELVGTPTALVTISHSYEDKVSSSALIVLDLRDPLRPVEAGVFYTKEFLCSAEVSGTLVFLAKTKKGMSRDQKNGMLILDIRDISRPRLVASVDTDTHPNNAYPPETSTAVAGGLVFLSHAGNGLRVYRMDNPEKPNEVYFTHQGSGHDVCVANNTVYVNARPNGLLAMALDSASTTGIREPTKVVAPSDLSRMKSRGRTMLALQGRNRVLVLDCKLPMGPSVVGVWTGEHPHYAFSRDGEHLLIAGPADDEPARAGKWPQTGWLRILQIDRGGSAPSGR